MKNKIKEYDNLECPFCDNICKPKKILKNGTVVYEKHDCVHESDYQFSIKADGSLIE